MDNKIIKTLLKSLLKKIHEWRGTGTHRLIAITIYYLLFTNNLFFENVP